MDHLVYLDAKSQELVLLLNGEKDIILRGATGRKLPYGRVKENDCLYFCENNASGIIKAKAIVNRVTFTDKLDVEASNQIVDRLQDRIKLHDKALKRFRGKRYLSVIEVGSVEEIDSFSFDKSNYSNMDDWLLVEDISKIL